jgi:hypothetical protein
MKSKDIQSQELNSFLGYLALIATIKGSLQSRERLAGSTGKGDVG